MELLAAMEAEDPCRRERPCRRPGAARYRALRDVEYERLCAGNPEDSGSHSEQLVC